jgi:hypothetical protein
MQPTPSRLRRGARGWMRSINSPEIRPVRIASAIVPIEP